MNWVLTSEEAGEIFDKFLIEIGLKPSYITSLSPSLYIDIWKNDKTFPILEKMLTEANDYKKHCIEYPNEFKGYLK